MHEYSIVQSLLDLVEENAKKYGVKEAEKIKVKIGILSGVEPHLLQIAFDTFKEKTICQNAELEMIIQPIVAKCEECQEESEFEKNEIFFECKKCKSANLKILDGEDMYLLSIEFKDI